MKLIRVYHSRCGEYDGSTYFLVPSDYKRPHIEAILQNACNNYIEAVVHARSDPPNDFTRWSEPNYGANLDKTVREVREEWEEKKRIWEEWANKGYNLENKNFADFVKDLDKNIITLPQADDIEEYEINWGHHHSLFFDYSDEDTEDNLYLGDIAHGESKEL